MITPSVLSAPPQSLGTAFAWKASHIPELDGLRGLLAWWVVASHVLLSAGYSTLPPGIRLLLHGDYAVRLFIILSGFVISKLLIEGGESYSIFIMRRFFRLYPTYLVCLATALIAKFLIGDKWSLFSFRPPELENWTEIHARIIPHLLAHFTLLHGAIPDHLLPHSKYALLGPAWSLSLEWQFYLVAPFAMAAIRRSGSRALFAIIVLFLTVNYFTAYSEMIAFLPTQLAAFALGIASYALVANSRRCAAGEIVMVGVAPLVLFFSWNIPLALWTCILGLMLADNECRLSGVVRAFFNSALMQHLGRISYTTYLCHFPLIFVLEWLILRLLPGITPPRMLALLLPSTVLVTWLFSIAVYRLVEAPGIRLGRRLQQSISRARTSTC